MRDDLPALLSLERFKERAKDDKAVDCRIRKVFETQIKETDDERTIEFVASDESVDRDDDTIKVSGWRLDSFAKAGAFLWAHNASNPPIGKPLATWTQDNELRTKVEFLPADFADHEHARFADMIRRMYQQRFLRGVSVGFKPIKYMFNEERSGYAIDFVEQELLEISGTPVPSNPNALVAAKAAGIDLAPLGLWVSKELDSDASGLERDELELIHKLIGGDKAIVSIGFKADETGQLRLRLFTGGDPADMQFRAAITYNAAHPDGTPNAAKDAEWDGPKQVAAADVSDLRIMSTWVDAENADTKGAYKLPHHKGTGQHALVWRGVTAAMGALLGARGGVDIPDSDKQSVYNHLAKHYTDFDEEAPEFRAYDSDQLAEMFPEKNIQSAAQGDDGQAVSVDKIEAAMVKVTEALDALATTHKEIVRRLDNIEAKQEGKTPPEPPSIVDADGNLNLSQNDLARIGELMRGGPN